MTRIRLRILLLAVMTMLGTGLIAYRLVCPPSYPSGAEISRELHRMGLRIVRVSPPSTPTVEGRQP